VYGSRVGWTPARRIVKLSQVKVQFTSLQANIMCTCLGLFVLVVSTNVIECQRLVFDMIYHQLVYSVFCRGQSVYKIELHSFTYIIGSKNRQ